MHIEISVEVLNAQTSDHLASFWVAAVPRTDDVVQIGKRQYAVSKVVWFPTDTERGIQTVAVEVVPCGLNLASSPA